jgi:hypothetical protein
MSLTPSQPTPWPARLAHLAKLLAMVVLAYTAAIIAGVVIPIACMVLWDALFRPQAAAHWSADSSVIFAFLTFVIIGWLLLWPAMIGLFALLAIFEKSIRRHYPIWSVAAIALATAAVAVYGGIINKDTTGGMGLAEMTFAGATTFSLVGRWCLRWTAADRGAKASP